MRNVVIYHAHCTDGFGAAYAAWKHLGDDAVYLPAMYHKHNSLEAVNEALGSPIDKDTRVYVLDFSFKQPVTEQLANACGLFVWLDHHKTAFDDWCGASFLESGETKYEYLDEGHVRITLDNNRSGARLAWEYFNKETTTPMVIQHIDDRDRWKFQMKGTEGIHLALQLAQPWTFEKFDELCDNDNYGSLFAQGMSLHNYQRHQVGSLTKYARPVCIDITVCDGPPTKFKGLAVNTSVHMSEVGHELANASGTFGLIWYLGEDCNAKCSLRSNGDYDVSSIAKEFGGGGHKNAAGFSVPITTLLGWLK